MKVLINLRIVLEHLSENVELKGNLSRKQDNLQHTFHKIILTFQKMHLQKIKMSRFQLLSMKQKINVITH